jgi:release factor glutamine methyltransferase
MTLRELLADADAVLRTGPHPERARLDAETLLLHIMAQNRAWLLAQGEDGVDAETQAALGALIMRRSAGEPMQYITGQTEFFGLPFSVTPAVLIPRPETEHLVEEALRLAAGFVPSGSLRIADIGTGSGAIAVTLAHSLPLAQIVAVDLSSQALIVAQHNADLNHVAERIRFFNGDLLMPLTGQTFSMILSNPPYVPLRDRASLSVEVREYEPHAALFAGDDGLAIYRRLIPDARELLVADGWLVIEIGYGQQSAVEELLQSSGYSSIHFIQDYQSIPRVAAGQKSGATQSG